MDREQRTDSLELMFKSFCLPTMASLCGSAIAKADAEGWSQLLEHLCQSEAADRAQRRTERLLSESELPMGKTLGNLDESLLTPKIRKQLPALLDGGFVENSSNVIAFGLPGRGKTHVLAAIGRELILRHGIKVLFCPTFKLVGRLLSAKRDLRLESELKKLDRYQVVILDDIGYVQQSREEMEVLFTFLAERYERRSLMISSNLVFSQWDQIFKDAMTTMAAIDRLVHHAIILEFDGASLRVKKPEPGPKNSPTT